MNNDDKQFFRGLLTDMDQKWDSKLDQRDAKWHSELKVLFDQQDHKWDTKFSDLKSELKSEIRHNGTLIEQVQNDLKGVAENVSDSNRRIRNLETGVADIKEAIHDYPILRETVKKHSRQLAKLK